MQKLYIEKVVYLSKQKRVNVDFLQIVEGKFTFITVEEVAADERVYSV